MITVRNSMRTGSVSARTGEAGLKAGMYVKFVAGAARGEQPKVVKASAADIVDATVKKGIVDYVQPDSQDVDFDINVVTQGLTPIAKDIPLNAQVNVWMGEIEIAYHESLLPAGFKAANVTEGVTKVAFDADTGLPALYAAGAADGAQIYKGMVYRVDGPEVSFILSV